jgi:ubiquinone/menaquinone biosynthesis C-methylase UbiE
MAEHGHEAYERSWDVAEHGPEAYEQYIVPAWMDAWARALVEGLGIKRGEHLLDLACGTGVVARRAAALTGVAGSVSGFDLDGAMLAVAQRHATEEGLPWITWHQGQVHALPFQDASFNAVACQHGLQFFPDRSAALREIHRVLVPGGRLAVSVWRSLDRCPFLAIVAKALEMELGIDPQVFQASCALADRDELRRLISGAAFRDVHIRLEVQVARYPSLADFLPGYLSVFPMADRLAALSPVQVAGFFRRLADAVSPFTDDDGLAAPMECHVATAVKPGDH